MRRRYAIMDKDKKLMFLTTVGNDSNITWVNTVEEATLYDTEVELRQALSWLDYVSSSLEDSEGIKFRDTFQGVYIDQPLNV